MKKILRIGSRGSPLALFQAEAVRQKLFHTHPQLGTEMDVEIVPIRTSGDWRPGDTELSFRETGGNKELFTKEIEEALLGQYIDMAVHSMKDVASILPTGLMIAALLERADPRDAFIGRAAKTLDALPEGSSIGTSSLRRQAQILAHRPDLRIVPMRGNLETRLEKLKAGKADAIVLAMAGLIRLGLEHVATSILESDVMLPAAAQGAIGIEIRQHDGEIQNLLKPINSSEAMACIQAERSLLRVLDGNCHTPIGAYAHFTTPLTLKLEAVAARPDGTSLLRTKSEGPVAEAEALGIRLGEQMKKSLPANFFSA
jgi:hydroxymethylbilane synthase